MKWLKELDASHTAITDLPDSITQLKELVYLKLDGCKKLKKLPKQFGNMVGLRIFCAVFSAIEQLPDSSVGLINLESLDLKGCKNLRNLPNSLWKLESLRVLDLGMCSKLKRLPDELEKMQCLEELNASSTGIEEVNTSSSLSIKLRYRRLQNGSAIKAVGVQSLLISRHCIKGEEVYYVVKCIRGDFISMRSGDRIKILLRRQLYSLGGDEVVAYEGGKEIICTLVKDTLSSSQGSSLSIMLSWQHAYVKEQNQFQKQQQQQQQHPLRIMIRQPSASVTESRWKS
ncbi:hypothetical protein AgCh_014829 [Apium graveolens]